MMNILHLEASPGWGGQEIRILREAEGMRSRGHSVILCVMKGGGLVAEACKAGFTVYELDYHKRSWPITLMRLLAVMRRHRIDIVNSHSSLDSWIGGFAAKIMRIPIVRTRHLSTPIRPGWNSRILYGWLADYVVTTCAAILPMICKQSGKPLIRTKSIPTGVDPARMEFSEGAAREFRRSLNVGENDFFVGTACFMRSWKGINDFLDAAKILSERKNLKWVIIGGGHEEEYRKRAAALDLGNIVYFTGHLTNPIYAIAALDAFALLSTAHEGVSQAILQAAYLGKPLIATSVGGLCEVCLDGQTGITVASFSPHQVAGAVEKLMKERNLCNCYGENARKLAYGQFTLQNMLDQMESVYCQVVAGHL